MTSTEMLRAIGMCVGCGDNHQQPGSDYCDPCIEEEKILIGAIAQVHAGSTSETVRDVQTRTLRDLFCVVTGHGATEMSPTCDHCGRKSQGRYCSSACRAATFSGRA